MDLTMEAGVSDASQGDQHIHITAKTDVPPEAGPWTDIGSIADVFKPLIERLAAPVPASRLGSFTNDLECSSIELYNESGIVAVFVCDEERDAAQAALDYLVAWDG